MNPINESFYQKPTLELAKSFLGMLLVHEAEDGITAGWIVETEAYIGPEDRAAHSFNNRRTKRTEVMFGKAGYVYTYVMHTHCLVNIVSGEVGHPEAVLIRAIEPYIGLEKMYERRGFDKKEQQLTNGPGKLTKAMAITQELYGHPIFQNPLYLVEGNVPKTIESGPRIGIGNSGEAREYPWRFWISENQFISR
ncbi:DNA-3-methyladenine glycosylase [Bacillus suaedae]|uniref:Putative 3-methyladenine DNA glycosylase n=1 Tax=Halalkalibacter suaedae TaxID=2822140 RepID=A0A941ARI7_9BACI|nr:DNA-3-methyladenine glycosylase [Bacillus suaedae]MBP3952708.1 DNA-3-methyladenine glycosylase [Bacillus suaedae]